MLLHFLFISSCNFFSDLKDADNALNMDTEDLDNEPCPPEGFHNRERDEVEGVDSDAVPPPPSDRVKSLRDVIDHTRHFISMVECPQWQILALDIVARCAKELAMEQ